VATLTSPGVGSNLDVKNIVSQLMSVERKPLTLLDDKVSSYNTKVSAYGKLKSALSSLQTAAQNLNLTSAFNKTKANVADTASLSANVSGVAIPGSYSIEVQSLAQSQKLISGGYGMVESPSASPASYLIQEKPPQRLRSILATIAWPESAMRSTMLTLASVPQLSTMAQAIGYL
jgi:flagellar capping protein FliD